MSVSPHPSSQLLSAILLLLRLWESGTREMDNERSTQGTSAPLLPLLQRFHNIHSSKEEPVPEEEAEVNISLSSRKMAEHLCLFLVDNQAHEHCCHFQILTAPLSPNESFLRYLTLPQDNDLAIDLRQTAVVIMAHLDRLASPCSPPHCNSPSSHKVRISCFSSSIYVEPVYLYLQKEKLPLRTLAMFLTLSPVFLLFQGTLQEVIAWGLLGWKLYANVNGPIQCKALSSLGVTQVVCSEKGFLILSSSGAVYTQNYKSTTLVSPVARVFRHAPPLIN